MTTWARNVANQAVDVTTVNPATIFFPALAAQFIVIPDGTQNGATYAGGVWTNPPAPPTPTAAPTVYPDLTPMQFYLAFTPTERMKIKMLSSAAGVPANSTLFSNSTAVPQDPVIAEFWATYELATQVNSPINPNLVSIQEGLAYLATPTAPTPAVITAARIPQIMNGIAQ